MKKMNEIFYEYFKGMFAMVYFFLYPFVIFVIILYIFYFFALVVKNF